MPDIETKIENGNPILKMKDSKGATHSLDPRFVWINAGSGEVKVGGRPNGPPLHVPNPIEATMAETLPLVKRLREVENE